MDRFLITASFFLVAGIGITQAASSTHWGYSGEGAPENWAKLTPDYAACLGKNQSPINLTGFIESELTPLKIDYQSAGNEIINNGHTVQVNYGEGSSISVDDKVFHLKQFHFHAPSENHIKGKSFPLETHFVHASDDGELAVIALMYKEGGENSELQKAWEFMPKEAGGKQALKTNVDAGALLPGNKDYYRFNGSLTTPPCSEGVRWFVMKDSVEASKEQIVAFSGVLEHANNRPIQAGNARPILQ